MQRVYVDLNLTMGLDTDLLRRRLELQDVDPEKLLEGLARYINRANASASSWQINFTLRLDALWMTDRKSLDELASMLSIRAETLQDILAQPTVLEIMQANPQLVILGDPGGGKSTLTRRLAGVLASAGRTDLDKTEAQWLSELDTIFGRRLLPVRIVMSRWAANLAEDATGCAADLIAECLRIQRQTANLSGQSQEEHFTARLTGDEPTALILLDGLDEVSDSTRRTKLLAAVKDFCQSFKNVPLIVTCRIRPYEAWTKSDEALALPTFTLAGLNRNAICNFIDRWHTELVYAERYEPDPSETAKARLLTAIDDSDRKDLREMAETPLLLTMMARVNYTKGLPNSRAMLYEEYVRQLLWEWEKRKLDDRGQPTNLEKMLQSANVSTGSLENALNRLAYTVHNPADDSEQAQDTVDIPRLVVRDALEGIHPGEASVKASWAVEVLKLIDDRSGLLYSKDENSCHFSHRTFQEYLAARWMASGKSLTKFKEKIDDEAWREAIFLALGFQISVHPPAYDDALDVFVELLPEAPATESDWRRILLLGDAYVHLFGPQRAREAEQTKQAERLIETVPGLITQTMQNPTLPPTQRLEAGKLLADLDVDPPDLDAFIAIPDQSFRIAKYPVTNRQFGRFIDAGGYQNDAWWTDEQGRAYRDEDKWTEPRYWHNTRFNWPNQPVIGVSWYEANAYCTWLTNSLKQNGEIGENEIVRLPTQDKWMAAARADEAAYPWGMKDFDAANATTQESNLRQTTPVHMYKAGKTKDGVWDLSGNVWQWSQDVDEDGWRPYLTGGSWRSDGSRATSFARNWNYPFDGGDADGFRLVVIPISLRR